MQLKPSSFSNDSFPAPNVSTLIFIPPLNMRCFISSQTSFYFIGYYITNIFLLIPLCIIILYLGVQQLWQRPSTSSTMSHSDIFTINAVIVDLFAVSGCIFSCCGIYTENVTALFSGRLLWVFSWCGESLFHALTCLEHYLAVVHPIIYMKLRSERGIRIRNVSIGGAWFLSVMGVCCIIIGGIFITFPFCVLALIMLVVAFCSLSVVCALIRPGPGEQGGTRERVNQTKKRAFHTIVAILGALMLRFFGGLLWMIVLVSEVNSACLILVSVVWFTLPSYLVIPLLFLHRAGKLLCCKNAKLQV